MRVRSKVLIVTPDFPFPAIHGGRVDYLNRIKCMSEQGLIVDLVSTVKEEIPEDAVNEMRRYVRSITLVSRSNTFIDLLSIQPYQIVSRKELKRITLASPVYDYILLESEHVISVLKNPSLKYRKAYLRIHNNESRYFYALGKSAFPGLSSLYYFLDGIKFAGVIRKHWRKFDKLLFISSKELQENKDLTNGIHLLPVYSKKDQVKSFVAKEGRTVLFIGSFFMPNNLEAINYYIKEVHPGLLDLEGYRFIVAGSTKSDPVLRESIIGRYRDIESLQLHFDLPAEKIDELYDMSNVFVNPVIHGAGVKLKVLEAIRNGMLVVSTSEGAAGTGFVDGEDIFIAANGQEMVCKIREALEVKVNAERMVKSSQQKLAETYNRLKELFSDLAE